MGNGGFGEPPATWYLRNSNSPGAPDIAPFAYGGPGWVPIVGDWDGNGTVTIYVRGQWWWDSHNADCNTDRAGAGVGIIWNDPDLGIAWPVREPFLSARDAQLGRLRDADNDFVYQGKPR